jgi:hypothetical protein
MNASPVSYLVFAGLLCASVALAEKPSPRDPSSEQEQQHIRMILERSPWAQRIPVTLVKPGAVAQTCRGNGENCLQDAFGPVPSRNTSEQGRGPAEPVNHIQEGRIRMVDDMEAQGITGVAVVRWASARTIRDALARMAPPSGKRMEAEELAQLAPVDAFVVYMEVRVALSCVKRVPRDRMLIRPMALHSTLLFKSTGQRIAAARVASASLPDLGEQDEQVLAAYYIYFPKLKDGHPWLTARDAEVRFECPLYPVPFHADFKLSRMQLQGVPDL